MGPAPYAHLKEAKAAAASTEQKGYFSLHYRCPYCHAWNESAPIPDSEYETWKTVPRPCDACGKEAAVLMD